METYKQATPSPLVSVLMCAYNSGHFIRRTIDSILRQSYRDFHFIIVENCSTDDTWEIIQSYKDPRIQAFRTNLAQLNFNLNYGLMRTDSELIARIDSDDVAHQDRLLKQVDYFRRHPGTHVLGGGYLAFGTGIVPKPFLLPSSNTAIRSRLPFLFSICHPTVMFRKSAILKIGGYAGGKFSQDMDLWMRLRRDPAVVFANLPDILLYYRIHCDQHKGKKESYAEVSGLLFREAILLNSVSSFLGWLLSILKVFKAIKK